MTNNVTTKDWISTLNIPSPGISSQLKLERSPNRFWLRKQTSRELDDSNESRRQKRKSGGSLRNIKRKEMKDRLQKRGVEVRDEGEQGF